MSDAMSSDCLYVCVRESEGGREGTSERARERERERERESKASVREKKEDGGTHTHAHPYTHTVKYTHTCTYTPQTGECCWLLASKFLSCLAKFMLIQMIASRRRNATQKFTQQLDLLQQCSVQLEILFVFCTCHVICGS
jgi:hypothetical protein